MNDNLYRNYQEQLNQYRLNGGKRWVGGPTDGHWITDPPVPPIYTSTDYNDILRFTNQNTPGQPEYGETTPEFLCPYLQQDASYAGTLTPFSTANTNFSAAYENMLPNTGKPATITNPNGLLPSQRGFSPNVVYAGTVSPVVES